jgi:ABC-2 type transport system permease protein
MNIRPLRVSAEIAARRVVAEPAGFIVTLGLYVVVVSVLGTLWRTAAGAHGGEIATYSAAALTWYVATSEAVTVSLNTRLIEELGDEIGTGAVAVELLRPVSLLGIRVASEMGRVLPRLAACAFTGIVLSLLMSGRPPNGLGLLLAAPAVVLAVACNVVAQHAFAAASFWIRDARSTWFVYQKVVFVVGGMLLPLEVLPGPMAAVARALPFMAMAYAPARLASGHVEPVLLLIQAGWLVALSAVAAAVFSAGERRLQVLGG